MLLMHCIVGHKPSEAGDVLDSSNQNRSKSQRLPIKMQVCKSGSITMNKWLLLRRGLFCWKNGVGQKNLYNVPPFFYPSNGRSSFKNSKGGLYWHKTGGQERA